MRRTRSAPSSGPRRAVHPGERKNLRQNLRTPTPTCAWTSRQSGRSLGSLWSWRRGPVWCFLFTCDYTGGGASEQGFVGHRTRCKVWDEPFTEAQLRLLRTWLGNQAHILDNLDDRGIDLFDVFVGPFARLSKSVASRGGTVVHLGFSYGQDFSESLQCTMCIALWVLVKPRHTWMSFSCTPWCA